LPKKIVFAEAIPHNPTGKILKRVLRDQCSVTVPM
jgi:acyl-coenzyme A synthetase/AMP-(fatty) acid ligase